MIKTFYQDDIINKLAAIITFGLNKQYSFKSIEEHIIFSSLINGLEKNEYDIETKIEDVVELPEFKNDREKLGISDEELQQVKDLIITNPNAGDVIKDCNGARKIRVALQDNNKGKSNGARIIYINVYVDKTSYLIDIYAKSDKTDLSDSDKKHLRTIVDLLKSK